MMETFPSFLVMKKWHHSDTQRRGTCRETRGYENRLSVRTISYCSLRLRAEWARCQGPFSKQQKNETLIYTVQLPLLHVLPFGLPPDVLLAQADISFQVFRLSSWGRYPCKSCVTHCYLRKALFVKTCGVLIQTLAVLQLPSRGPEVQADARQWLDGSLNGPGDGVTVLHYLVCGSASPVVPVMYIKLKVPQLSRKTF